MRMRSLGLAVAGALVLVVSYPVGQAAAQGTAPKVPTVEGQQRAIDGAIAIIAEMERAAQSELAVGNCRGYNSHRKLLGDFVFYITSGGGKGNGIPEITINEIAAQGRRALASLPVTCVPKKVVKKKTRAKRRSPGSKIQQNRYPAEDPNAAGGGH